MAKQSFSVGQVLTAAQMQSLQATAMGGGSPSVKTSSYVLVAADAGTVIQVNSTSATTITVNTGLFSAGDSVQIQNIGSGTTTITSGTATVNSAGSLGVTQYDGGFLYFSSASSAIWFDYTQAGTTLPLTTKGDLFGYSTTNARVPIGTNGQVLTADSAEVLGLKWAAPAGGGKVLQVVQATTSTAVDLNTTTYTDTNITASITPTSATSTILVMVSGSIRCLRTNSDETVINRTRLMRNATAVQTRSNTLYLRARQTSDNALAMVVPFTFMYQDSPATTSSTTYKIQGSQDNALGSFSFQYDSSPTTIILMEIGA